MPDLVISTVNGITSYSVDYIGKAVTIEKPLGTQHRIKIDDRRACLSLDELRALFEAGFFK